MGMVAIYQELYIGSIAPTIRIPKTWLSWNGKRASIKSFKQCDRREGPQATQEKQDDTSSVKDSASIATRGNAATNARELEAYVAATE